MSEDTINLVDNGSCPTMKSLISLGREVGTTSDQLRDALKKVQKNFRLTGGLILDAKESVAYKGRLWKWSISNNQLLIEVNRGLSFTDNIPREVLVGLIKLLPCFLRQVKYAQLNRKKALEKAKRDLEAINSVFGEVCFGRKSGRR